MCLRPAPSWVCSPLSNVSVPYASVPGRTGSVNVGVLPLASVTVPLNVVVGTRSVTTMVCEPRPEMPDCVRTVTVTV